MRLDPVPCDDARTPASRSILRMTTVPADPRGAPGRVAVVVVTFNSADVVPGLLASLPDGLADLDVDARRGGQRLARRHRRGGGVARPRRRGRAVRPQRGLRGRHQPRRRAGAGPGEPCSCSTPTSGWVPAASPSSSPRSGAREPGSWCRGSTTPAVASSRHAAASRPCAVRSRTRSSGRNGPGRSRTWVRSSPTPAPTRSSRPTDWAEGSTQLVSRRVLGRRRAVGRVVLPVLRGDRLRAARPRRRLSHLVRPDRARRAPGGRLGGQPGAVAAAGRQPAAPVQPSARSGRHGRLLGWCSSAARAAGRCSASRRAGPRCAGC